MLAALSLAATLSLAAVLSVAAALSVAAGAAQASDVTGKNSVAPIASVAIAPHSARRHGLIVKLRAEGPRAVEACAETVFREGRAFSTVSADRSSSLDVLHERLKVRKLRALFRRPDGRSFAQQRAAMRASHRPRNARRGVRAPAPGVAADADIPDLSHIYRVSIAPETSIDEALALYRADPHVEYVQRNHVHQLDSFDDPLLQTSGSWGQSFADLWGLYRIRAPEAWELSQGEGIVVAVVDTGLDYDHPDIAQNVWINPGEDLNGNGLVDESDWNGIDDDGNGFVDDIRGYDFANSIDANADGDFSDEDDIGDPDPFDDVGHGTHVSGTIAAVGNNGIGIAGVAPRAKIMALKGFPLEGGGIDSNLWRAVVYAIENGAAVVNNSWSCRPWCPRNPLAEEVVALARAMNVVIVTSAGNSNDDVIFNSPENLSGTITVASSGEDDGPSASFTNEGWVVDLSAPGGGPSDDLSVYIARRNILSLRSSASLEPERFSIDDDYTRWAGTSMASPHVAGVVALLRSLRPELDYDGVRRILRQSAVDLGAPGHDRTFGGGRLDARAALDFGPLPDLDAAIHSPRSASLFDPSSTSELEIRGTAAGLDLLSFDLHYGLGLNPKAWTAIVDAKAEPVEDGVLGRWQLDGLDQGTYVLRLLVRSVSGLVYSEFVQLSLERNKFRRISSEGASASDPDVSNRHVVWKSRRDPVDPTLESEDFNLFVTDLKTGAERVVSGAPGNQRRPSISGNVISWLDSRNAIDGADTAQVFGCKLPAHQATCNEFAVAPGVDVTTPPASAAGHIYWVDGTTGQTEMHGCTPNDGGSCESIDDDLPDGRKGFLRSSGDDLVWVEPGFRFSSCRVDRVSGACAPEGLASPVLSLSSPALSGDLFAWIGYNATGRGPLYVCERDPETGECPQIFVAGRVVDTRPEVSENLVVWEASVPGQKNDVYFCEFDRLLDRCPPQRLTAHMAEQSSATVDRRNIVWADARDGATAIYGIELPRLRVRDRNVFARATLVLPVGVLGGDDPRAALSVEAADEVSIAELGAYFFDGGRGRGLLWWRPQSEHVGEHLFTFTATSDTGLATRRSVRVTVLERPAPRPWWWWWLWRS